MDINTLRHKIKRLSEQKAVLVEQHKDKDLNYHGGRAMGLLEGRLSAFEDMLDDLESEIEHLFPLY